MTQMHVQDDSGLSYITPRWVKVLAIFIIVLVLLLGIMIVTGNHGPGRHISSGSDSDGHTSPIEHGVQHP